MEVKCSIQYFANGVQHSSVQKQREWTATKSSVTQDSPLESGPFFMGRVTSYIILGKYNRQLHTRQTNLPSPALKEKKHFSPLETLQCCSANHSCSDFLPPFS